MLDKARDAFIRAAAALTDTTRDEKDAVAMALVESTYGLFKLVETDGDRRAYKKVMTFLSKVSFKRDKL